LKNGEIKPVSVQEGEEMKKLMIISIFFLAFGFSQNTKINNGDQSRLSPKLLNYQGFITDTLGNPITNPAVSVTFGIWTSSGGGTQLWFETQPISISKGIFSVLLGTITTIPDSVFTKNTDRWLELTYAGITLSPRTRIVSVPYAYTTTNSDTAAYARLLQGKDTTALDARYVNEGQVNSIFTPMIIDTAVTMAKIARAGASTNQVIKWTGAAWQPATDLVGADADWNYLVSDGADTTLQTGGRWGLARLGDVLLGNADSTHVNFGGACTTGVTGFNYKYCTVGGGLFNLAGNYYASASGGIRNRASGYSGTVAGGFGNTASGNYATVSGGAANVAGSDYATVAGGYTNVADNAWATVGGGYADSAKAYYSGVGSGYRNRAGSAIFDTCATVTGGWNNTASRYSFVGGGMNNTASGNYATAVGGYNTRAFGDYATVGGGGSNRADQHAAFVGGGVSNTAWSVYSGVCSGYSNRAGSLPSDTAAAVAGGQSNDAQAKYSYVGGGQFNYATSVYGTVGGGYNNTASNFSATVAGGSYNIASGNYGTVAGGYANVASDLFAAVGGGYVNGASGYCATTGGGKSDSARAPYSGVFSGYLNIAGDATSDTAAAVCGGTYNKARAEYTYVGGGSFNRSNWGWATVGGGYNNVGDSWYGTIGGGNTNSTQGSYATVGGGGENNAIGYYSTVAGGYSNNATDDYTTVGGGYDNEASYGAATVSGGEWNVASGHAAAVAGGRLDTAAAHYSFTVGNNSTVLSGHDNSAAFNGMTSTTSGETRVGILSKAAGSFTIDHPLDPEHKILNHYFVESPEMVLIYRGKAIIGEDGRSAVHLPDYFDALNEDPQIQLTGVGTYEVFIAENEKNNAFVIGGKPGTEVHWTVTGSRKDPSAEITKVIMPVEQVKEGGLAGRSLDDELLVSTMAKLERMGQSAGFKFRHASEQKRYEEMKRMIEEKGSKK
jgi:hypothetical protein